MQFSADNSLFDNSKNKEKKKKWSKSKQLLVACIIPSLVLGFGVVTVIVYFIFQNPWYAQFAYWIPLAFLIGFILPPIAYALTKLGY